MTTAIDRADGARAPDEPELEQLARRVDDAAAAVAGLDPSSRAVAEELKAAVEAIHRAGLVAVVRRLKAGGTATEALYDLVDDPVVHLLLSLHRLVRADPTTAAQHALSEVTPRLRGHGGDVELVRVDNGTVVVRLHGACNGCSAPSVTLRELVRTALIDHVPGVAAVEFVSAAPSPTLIPLESLRIGRGREDDGWVRLCAAAELSDGGLTRASCEASPGEVVEAIVVDLGQRLSAFRNVCAHQGLPLDGAVLDVAGGTLTCPWHGFSYDAASGECLTAPGVQLEQLPLRVRDSDIWIQVVS